MLRDKYLRREERPTFCSVILAGVHDIKNLKLQVSSEMEHQYNSPCVIANIREEDGSYKKVVLYYTGLSSFIQYGAQMISKGKAVMIQNVKII